MNTIAQIKENLGYPVLHLNPSVKDGNPTGWLRHWDNNSRIAVSMHEETYAKIKEDPTKCNLTTQIGEKVGEQGTYKTVRIVAVKESAYQL